MHHYPGTFLPDVKPFFRQIALKTDRSFHVKVFTREKLWNIWHYHHEMELILLKRTAGTRIIGTHVATFSHNDVLFIGQNVPHVFLHKEKYLKGNNSLPPQAVVIQFDEDFMGKDFLNLPELKDIQHLFRIASHGIALTENSRKKVIPLMEKMLSASSLDRIFMLLEILRIMVGKNAFRVLMKEGLLYQLKIEDNERIQDIIHFTTEHYDKNIKIEEVAELAHLTRESFCRYFKTQTGKTYIEFLIEFRIKVACRKLMENKESIKEIGYACGFDSPSNFHYQFKKIMNQSPLEYRSKCLPQLKKIHDTE